MATPQATIAATAVGAAATADSCACCPPTAGRQRGRHRHTRLHRRYMHPRPRRHNRCRHSHHRRRPRQPCCCLGGSTCRPVMLGGHCPASLLPPGSGCRPSSAGRLQQTGDALFTSAGKPLRCRACGPSLGLPGNGSGRGETPLFKHGGYRCCLLASLSLHNTAITELAQQDPLPKYLPASFICAMSFCRLGTCTHHGVDGQELCASLHSSRPRIRCCQLEIAQLCHCHPAWLLHLQLHWSRQCLR